ncbi:hypothetical protein FOZ61_008910 [Perkinsus olseni]|uniref:Uncharacterized protein n=1 Tax=Perkinsus olseni TaxID=32597 RepID=A0A7J6L2Z9_PEROL|nr:hypothetical protein FOZ61_008910 [Perkinsus olseni]
MGTLRRYIQDHCYSLGRKRDIWQFQENVLGYVSFFKPAYTHICVDESSYRDGVFEIRYVQCRKAQEVRLAYEFHEPGDDPSFSFIRFSPVPDRPRAVDFIYKSDSTLHSMKIDVVRESGPTLFSTRRDEMVESERIRGSLIRNTPGLGFLLIEEGDFYVLRHGRGLKKAARIAKCGTTLPSSVVFGDWSFRYTLKLITEDLAVVKYHPYLL